MSKQTSVTYTPRFVYDEDAVKLHSFQRRTRQGAFVRSTHAEVLAQIEKERKERAAKAASR